MMLLYHLFWLFCNFLYSLFCEWFSRRTNCSTPGCRGGRRRRYLVFRICIPLGGHEKRAWGEGRGCL